MQKQHSHFGDLPLFSLCLSYFNFCFISTE